MPKQRSRDYLTEQEIISKIKFRKLAALKRQYRKFARGESKLLKRKRYAALQKTQSRH